MPGGENVRSLSPSSTVVIRHEPQKRSAEHERLEPYVGAWTTTGRAFETPLGPEGTLEVTDTFEWLSGGQFLVHRLDGHLDDKEISCIEMFWYDAANEVFAIQTYYNNGTMNAWLFAEEEGAWVRTGEWAVEDVTMKARLTSRFTDPDTIEGKWEYSEDGRTWNVFWEVVSKRRVKRARGE
jgi:hypothetical protein